ncbi:MAG: PQQ-dependent sugar dehydrogenase, partial [Rubrivivax sp.]|nr:PQQ-dependent sugar dehydrogenase [Pyrinomonadaceae bacterium]
MTITRIKLLVVLLFVISVGVFLLTDNSANPHARAFSSGPPAGYTRAPGEEPEACAECHVVESTGSGTISLSIPQTYTPGQSYNITVTHANTDQTRIRWGFQLTALDPSEEKAGTLEPLDNLTQVLNNQGPIPARQYIEHTSAGTFPGQLGGASWTFKWTAPAEDVGPVTFYAAGNHANGDGNTSGDNIYFTFAAATFAPPTPDFQVTVIPSTRTFAQGGGTTYDVTVTPLNGFTGQVALNVNGLPANTFASFQPATVNITDATPKTSVLSVSSSASTPTGSFTLDINATSGQLSHTAQAAMNVVSAGDADISISQIISPNPAQVGVDLKFTITVTNNGPATASGPTLTVRLPRETTSFVKGAGTCTLVVNTNELGYACVFNALSAGESSTIDFTVRPPAAGSYNTTATARASENDPFPANNTVISTIPVASPSASPRMTVSNLGVRTVVSGLNQPTSMAFIAANDFFVLEKATGRVVRVTNGIVQAAVLDLAVNSASERGLLGITLHPNFATNNFVYLYWTESSTGVDTTAIDEVPLLGNRVDRYV